MSRASTRQAASVSIDAETRLVALIGDPVEHSLSPLIHNTAFMLQDLNAAYVALRVKADAVADAVRGLAALEFMGANVTVPHKRAVAPLLDELSPQAQAVGAVNTVICREGRLIGDNTDVAGFLEPLPEMDSELDGAPMTVLGSGGAARAVAYGLLTAYRPARLTLAARTPSSAEQLAADLAPYDRDGALRIEQIGEAHDTLHASKLVVNATPVGMHPKVDDTPWPEADSFHDGQIVYDLVYNPEVTRLLREAGLRGARTIGGLDMLVGQAAAAYAQWTGRDMPVSEVKNVLRKRWRR